MKIYAYLLVMALTTYLIRVLPLTIFRRPIRNVTVRSFLHYVPYACLTAMTFPAILSAGTRPPAGWAALAVGIFLAARKKSLMTVALGCSGAFFLTDWIFSIFL